MDSAALSLPPLRILLAHHASLADGAPGNTTRRLFDELRQRGHHVRLVTIGDTRSPINVDHCVIDARTGFESFGDHELFDYRDRLRDVLDAEIRDFDPHLVHAQHAWLFAHLALEAGVPYVANLWPAELDALARDNRFERIAHEAAENAGRLIVSDEQLSSRLSQVFTGLDRERLVFVRPDDPAWIDHVLAAYRATLTQRFGDSFRN